MPKKPTKWGIKAWVLADSRTGYVHNLQLYSGNSIVVPVQVISNVIKNIYRQRQWYTGEGVGP